MKPALYYSLSRGWGGGIGYSVVAVTTEKGSRAYGRDQYGNSCHWRLSDLTGRFESEDLAKNTIASIKEVREKFKPEQERLAKAQRDLSTQESNEIKAILEKCNA